MGQTGSGVNAAYCGADSAEHLRNVTLIFLTQYLGGGSLLEHFYCPLLLCYSFKVMVLCRFRLF